MLPRLLCSLSLPLLLLVSAWQLSPAQPTPESRPSFKSPLGLAVDQTGEMAYVALHTAGTVAVVDLKAGKVLREIGVGKGPYELALTKQDLYVTCEEDDTLVAIDREKHTVRRRIRLPQAPRGLALGPGGTRLYIACRDASVICTVEIATDLVRPLPVPARPDRIVLLQEGYVLALAEAAGEASILSLHTRGETILHNSLAALCWPGGSAPGLRGLALGPRRPLVAYQKPRFQIPATQVAQGWVFTSAVSELWGGDSPHGPQYSSWSELVLDEPNRGFADPSDVAMQANSWRAFVAAAGADTVLLVDLEKHAAWSDREGKLLYGTDDLTASRHYVTARLPTQANPRRLALSGDGKMLVVSNYLADSLTVIDTARARVIRHIPLGGPEPDAVRRGEILFHSGRMTFQGQFTCASCHPEGGSDGLSWDLERDGIGNLKNTRSLRGVKDTAPYGWHGSSPTLADRVRGTLRTLHRHEPTEEEVSDLVAYLESLPPPRPLPLKEAEKPALARGRVLFEGKGKCLGCHYRAALDDDRTHDVGTRGPTDTQDRFDTPALRGVARTAPYLHDGRAATLEEVFTKHNLRQRHGAAHLLTPEELADLVAYLKSL
jgi:YVTN family beta-propeller protein